MPQVEGKYRPNDSPSFPPSRMDFPAVAIEFHGATLKVLALSPAWKAQQLDELSQRPLSSRRLPSKEEVSSSLFAPDAAIQAIRNWSQYACHDIRVVTRKPDGEMLYLATRRLEPGKSGNIDTDSEIVDGHVKHSAPINGCWWPPGGKIMIPFPKSALEQSGFDVVDSILLKLSKEIGLTPDQVVGIHFLGVGETNFSEKMAYVYRGRDEDGSFFEFTVPVKMPAPQHTINKNYIVEVKPETVINLSTLTSAAWIDRQTYERNRPQFCAYEQIFIDAVFKG